MSSRFTNAELFAAWLDGHDLIAEKRKEVDIALQAKCGITLDQAEAELGADWEYLYGIIQTGDSGYPVVKDSGECEGLVFTKEPRESFAEWFAKNAAYDPKKGDDGWRPLI